jgi:CheY-like chemotaxis protein
MDGFALLAHLSKHYPDIPVIVLTAFGTPNSKRKVLERGAAGFMEKPFVVEDLAEKVLAGLAKQSEGGTLQTVPLDMFIQLVEMEAKTCTLRVQNRSSQKKGVLFFKDGQLMDARSHNVHGKEAAYEIFSWDKVSLFIEDNCAVSEKRIEEDLQAILFDAMRMKDEAGTDEADFDEGVPEPEAAPEPEPAPQGIRDRVEAILADNSCAALLKPDSNLQGLTVSIKAFGEAIAAGEFKSGFFSYESENGMIIVQDADPMFINIDDSCPRDLIPRLLYAWRVGP